MYHIYFAALILTCVLGAFLSFYAWQRRAQPAIHAFTYLTLATTFTTICFFGLGISPNETWAYFWTRLRFIGLALIPVFYLQFTLSYLDHPKQAMLQRYGWILYLMAVIANLLIWTTPDLLLSDWQVEKHDFLYVESSRFEGAGRLFVLYSYGIIFCGLILFAQEILRSAPPYRWRALILFSGSLISLFSNVPAAFNLLPPDTPSLTPIGFGIRNILFAWALFAFKLLDIVPIAYAAIFKSIPDSAIVLDTQNRIVNLNPAASRLLNTPLSNVIGKPAETVFAAWPQHIQRYNALLEAQDEIAGDTGQFYELKISPLYRQNDQLAGRLIFLRDITERKQAELDREALIQTLNKYAQVVAHDLKNPLSVILGFADLLQAANLELDAESRMMLSKIIETSISAAQIVDELLLFASIRSKNDIPRETVDIQRSLRAVLRRLDSVIKKSEAQILVADMLPNVIGYSAWVEEVWANLLTNALKYGGSPPMIHITCESQANNMLCFNIRDNGDGLTPEEQQQIFTQFTRLEKHGQLTGNGLGLTIVQMIVERLGGQIGIQSEVGRGSTFYFTLPAM